MEEVKDIILTVYTLSVPPTTEPNSPAATAAAAAADTASRRSSNAHWSSFLVSKILPSVGMGAYHTSIRIGSDDQSPYTTTYTFAANRGIVPEKRPRSRNTNDLLPSHATFKEEIILGSCTCQRGEVNEVVQQLSQHYFTDTSYHLVHRNCNHFTETFATALIYYQEFMNLRNNDSNNNSSSNNRNHIASQRGIRSPRRLSTYPDWINRLANTGANVISHDIDIVPCHPYNEAYHAVTKTTIDGSTTIAAVDNPPTSKTTGRWAFPSVVSGSKPTSTSTTTGTTTTSSSTTTLTAAAASKGKKKNEKKELTAAQQKILDQIRKK
jgi:hypothetical protein